MPPLKTKETRKKRFPDDEEWPQICHCAYLGGEPHSVRNWTERWRHQQRSQKLRYINAVGDGGYDDGYNEESSQGTITGEQDIEDTDQLRREGENLHQGPRGLEDWEDDIQGSHRFMGPQREGSGELSYEEEEQTRRDYPELFDELAPPGSREQSASNLDGLTTNQRLLLEIGTTFPFGKTTQHEPEKVIKDSFDYFRLKVQHNITTSAMNDVLRACRNNNNPYFESLNIEQTIRQLLSYSGLDHIRYDCCVNSCVCFVEFPDASTCPVCSEPRWIRGKSAATFDYISVIHRLRAIWANPQTAKRMTEYRQETLGDHRNGDDEILTDFWTGNLCAHWQRTKNVWRNYREMGFILTTNGIQLFKLGKFAVWPLILINLNLPPIERTKAENMIVAGIIPGPNGPTDLDSFLRPVVDEFTLLFRGVDDVYDGHAQETFKLRGHIALVTGDLPAVAKLTGTKGVNAMSYCRFCRVRGYWCPRQRHVYCPLNKPRVPQDSPGDTIYVNGQTPGLADALDHLADTVDKDATLPQDLSNSDTDDEDPPELHLKYDPARLPMRTDAHFRSIAPRVTGDPKLGKLHGINHLPILCELETIHFFRSFPLDIMHLVFEGLAPIMLSHWQGEFFPSGQEPKDHYVLSKRQWSDIGKDMEASVSTFPTCFGKPPRDISKYRKGFKASEWMNWATIFSPILLKGRLPDPYYTEWVKFTEVIANFRTWAMTDAIIDSIEARIISFVQHYEQAYYQYKASRVSACRSTIHYFLHLGDNIRDCGPPAIFWQFPAERICGILTQKVKSRASANRNLSLALLRTTQMELLPALYPTIQFTISRHNITAELDSLQENPTAPLRDFTPLLGETLGIAGNKFSHPGYAGEQIWFTHWNAVPPPSVDMIPVEKSRLREFIEIYQGRHTIPDGGLPANLQLRKYSHCAHGMNVFRSLICPQRPNTREAFTVSYTPCNQDGQPIDDGPFHFARIHYFTSLTWNDEVYMLALVRKLNTASTPLYGDSTLVYITGEGALEFIDVRFLTTMVGSVLCGGKDFLIHATSALIV